MMYLRTGAHTSRTKVKSADQFNGNSKKCGSVSSPREFRRLGKAISDQDETHGHIPDYAVRLESDMVIIMSKGSISVLEYSLRLDPETYDQA